MKIFLPEIVRKNGALDMCSLPSKCNTKFISVTRQDGSGKTSLRDNIAEYLSEQGKTVITAKSPCDAYLVKLLNNAISQDGYNDWYTEQMLFSFADGLLSNYMLQINGRCDYFVCQRGPIDQYAHGVTRSHKTYGEIYQIQRPERLAKFDVYIHMNCDAKVAWERVAEDEGKDRYEYPEYFERQVENTKKLYQDIIKDSVKELGFLNSAKHVYIDTTNLTIQQTFEKAMKEIEDIL